MNIRSWSRESKAVILLNLLILTALIIGCTPSREEQLQIRLDNFRKILPAATREAFDNKEYTKVTSEIDSLLTVDSVFAEHWLKIKQTEAIGLFSVAEVVEYFATNFADRGKQP